MIGKNKFILILNDTLMKSSIISAALGLVLFDQISVLQLGQFLLLLSHFLRQVPWKA